MTSIRTTECARLPALPKKRRALTLVRRQTRAIAMSLRDIENSLYRKDEPKKAAVLGKCKKILQIREKNPACSQ